MTDAVGALIAASQSLLRAKADRMGLSVEEIDSIRIVRDVMPASLPALASLPEVATLANTATAELAGALVRAAPELAWRQTYDEEDGFDRHYLDSYGWCDLAGPTGPCDMPGLRLMFGVWGAGIHYPDHSHPPDEHYLVLAGEAWFRLGDDPYARLGPGEVFHTPPHAVHSADMRDAPLLAMAIWRAEDLSVNIDLTEIDRQVSKQ